MKIRINYYYILHFIIHLIQLISSNYVHEQLDGNLLNGKSANFSIFFKNFTGMVLYGMDSFNKILIEIENNEIHFKLNDYSTIENSTHLCGCLRCTEIYMTFILHLEDRYILTECNNKTTKLNADEKKNISISAIFNGYPIPVNYNKDFNRTFIWMGNVGPYIGSNHITTHALNNQLVGCLHKLYFNGKRISVKSVTNKFKSFCPTEYNENVCLSNDQCKNSSISYNITDCSISSLNRRFCVKNLYQYNQSNNSSLNYLNDEICIIRIDWMIYPSNKDLCLLEFPFRNGNTLLFYVAESKNVVMINKNKMTNENQRILTKISVNSYQTMIVNFTETDLILRLSEGENINTFILPKSGEPISVNVGLQFPEQNCQKFEGLMNFQNKTCVRRRIKTTSTVVSTVSKRKHTTFTTTMFKNTITENAITKLVTKISNLVRKEIKEDIKITTSSILLIVISVFLFFILFLIVFYCIIRKELQAHIRKISTASPLKPPDSRNREVPPNEYEILQFSRDSGGYDTIPDNP